MRWPWRRQRRGVRFTIKVLPGGVPLITWAPNEGGSDVYRILAHFGMLDR